MHACVYCGTICVLSDEHIVPAGLGGDQILREASCGDCADATSKLEQRVLRLGFGLRLARSHLKIGKRRPKERLTEGLVETEHEGERFAQTLPIAEHPIPISLPLFCPPTIRAAPLEGQQVKIRGYHQYVLGAAATEVLAKLGTDRAFMKVRNYDAAFARMIGKIALCSWLAEFGRDTLSESWLPAMILGERGGIGRAVGGLDYALRGMENAPCLHSVHLSVRQADEVELAIARVQLFLEFTPSVTYGVNIGVLRDGISVDPALRTWYLPRCGSIGRPIVNPLPRWVGTTFLGSRGDGQHEDIHAEMRAIGLEQ
jgi:hypothetical protein